MTTATSTRWQPPNPDYERVVTEAFRAQTAMALIEATLDEVAPGYVAISLACHDRVMSHIPGIVHGGTIGMVADSAMGFAGLTLAPVDGGGVTAEYKINMLAPAMGERLIARGRVVKPGAKITVAQAEVHVVRGDREKLVATALGTLVPF